ncbi:Probable zinc metalloprotease PTRG_04772 [Durusdinium trenchii]|uniref:Probable zinc metalloprotease PTRG_04772 n=1 Tax=Durusdinium trenchii TaxID=1381693 RepID=A0ABP0LB51_9DINO
MRLAALLLALTRAFELPRIHPEATSLLSDGKWWAQVGDHVVHTPHASSGLSTNIGNYYYAYGSHKALNDELRDKRVGGAGRVHIFHLPEGKESLATTLPKVAGRRDSLSSLVQLNHKDVLSDAKLFPDFELPKDLSCVQSYKALREELCVVDSITSDSMMQQLTELVQLGDGTQQTRSYSNPVATANSVRYLQKKFKDMGYQTCKESFSDQNDVVAFLPGSESGSVTIGGHYDSRPFEGLAPGAVDNGSGASAVLAIAKAIADAGVKPKKTLVFACFAAEEPGLRGSEELATRLSGLGSSTSPQDGEKGAARIMSRLCGQDDSSSSILQANSLMQRLRRQDSEHKALVMDEIAWRSSATNSPVVNLESYDWADKVLKHLAGASQTHNGDRLRVTHSNNPFGSDHMSFLQKNMQSVLSIHGDDESYPHYHQASDDLDQVNPELYTLITKMNAGAALRLAGVSK